MFYYFIFLKITFWHYLIVRRRTGNKSDVSLTRCNKIQLVKCLVKTTATSVRNSNDSITPLSVTHSGVKQTSNSQSLSEPFIYIPPKNLTFSPVHKILLKALFIHAPRSVNVIAFKCCTWVTFAILLCLSNFCFCQFAHNDCVFFLPFIHHI